MLHKWLMSCFGLFSFQGTRFLYFQKYIQFSKGKIFPSIYKPYFQMLLFPLFKIFFKKYREQTANPVCSLLISYYLSISLSFFKILFLKLKIFLEDTCCSFAKSRMVIFLKYKESITFSSSSFSFRSA